MCDICFGMGTHVHHHQVCECCECANGVRVCAYIQHEMSQRNAPNKCKYFVRKSHKIVCNHAMCSYALNGGKFVYYIWFIAIYRDTYMVYNVQQGTVSAVEMKSNYKSLNYRHTTNRNTHAHAKWTVETLCRALPIWPETFDACIRV